MSHDPQSPSDAADFYDDGDEPDALCCDCGDQVYAEDVSVEVFERFNDLLCPGCFEDRCEDEGAEEDETP